MKRGGRNASRPHPPPRLDGRHRDHATAPGVDLSALQRSQAGVDWSEDAAGPARREKGRAMFKDLVVNLSGRGPRDFAADYATSIAAAFGARIAGISFLYEPVIPDGTLGGIPVDLIELQCEDNSKLATDAV